MLPINIIRHKKINARKINLINLILPFILNIKNIIDVKRGKRIALLVPRENDKKSKISKIIRSNFLLYCIYRIDKNTKTIGYNDDMALPIGLYIMFFIKKLLGSPK